MSFVKGAPPVDHSPAKNSLRVRDALVLGVSFGPKELDDVENICAVFGLIDR